MRDLIRVQYCSQWPVYRCHWLFVCIHKDRVQQALNLYSLGRDTCWIYRNYLIPKVNGNVTCFSLIFRAVRVPFPRWHRKLSQRCFNVGLNQCWINVLCYLGLYQCFSIYSALILNNVWWNIINTITPQMHCIISTNLIIDGWFSVILC